MSEYGDDTRRVTRASSRAASVDSRASSVEAGSQLGNSARRTRRTARQGTAPADQPETGTKSQRSTAREAAAIDEPDVEPKTKKQGNKRTAAYGTKGKRYNPEQMSADAATADLTQRIQASAAFPAQLPTGGAAGQLPVLAEEGESIYQSIEGQQREDPPPQILSSNQGPVQPQVDEQLHASLEAQIRDSVRPSRQGSVHSTAGVTSQSDVQGQGRPNLRDSVTHMQSQATADATVLGGRSWISNSFTAIRNRFPWVPIGQANARDAAPHTWNARDVAHRGQAWDRRADLDEDLRQMVDNEFAQRTVPRSIIYVLCFLVFTLVFLMAEICAGPLFGPNFDMVANHSRSSPSGNGTISLLDAQYHRSLQKSQTRLDKLESFVRDLVSSTSASPPPKPIHQINWFAAANGAVVNPYLSSPVALVCWGIREHTWFTRLMAINGKCIPASRAPGQALRPWSEPDERWCAPPGRGKLQLTVLTARPIAPTDLILEHMPKDASLRIGDAPREIELWVDVPNPEVNARVRDGVGRMYPNYVFSSSPQRDRELDEDQALPDTFVPVGRWIYNIYKDDHIQSFRVPLPLREFGVNATRFAVRANSNWGDYHSTCIYRTRLHGHDLSGIVEHLEEEPDEE